MTVNQLIQIETFAFLMERASHLFFLLSKEGKIVEANQYARNFTGRNLIGETFQEVIVDFKGEFDLDNLTSDLSGERLINISNSFRLPQSFYFTFKQIPDFTLAFGRLDVEDLEKMRKEMVILNQESNNLTRALHKKTAQLQDALNHVKTLQGIVPICMHCHNIRSDKQIWEKLDAYLTKHTEAKLSHGICPECAKKLYPEFDLYDDDSKLIA